MRLNPAAIPNHNRIDEETALEWAANLGAIHGPVQELLADLLLSLGVHSDLTGAERAVLNMLLYLPGIKESASQTQINTAIQLLHERIPFMRGNPEKATNRLVRFHVLGADCPLYTQLGESMHCGIVGKYQQVQGEEESEVNNVVSRFCGPINIVLPHLRNPEILLMDDVKTLKTSLKSVIKNLPMKIPGASTRYKPGTVDGYANTIAAALLDRERYRQFVAKGSYKRRRKPKFKPDDSFYPDLLPTSHPIRRAYRDSAQSAVIAEMAEADPERAERIKSSRGHSTSWKQRALLAYVHGLVPPGTRVSVAGDAEFGGVEVQKLLRSWGWKYVLRQKGRSAATIVVIMRLIPVWLFELST